jgi:hypothetical protein
MSTAPIAMKPRLRNRELKRQIAAMLNDDAFAQRLERWDQFVPRQVVNPLFSFFFNAQEIIKWRAVTAMGVVVARLAQREIESARVVMRRLMWTLNDESGGIGWGSPEAMGDIMARSHSLAQEYSHILLSYMNPAGNWLEHEILQRGVVWGVGRLAHVRAALMTNAVPLLEPLLESGDAYLRGLAAWAAGAFDAPALSRGLHRLAYDTETIMLYDQMRLMRISIRQLAQTSLSRAAAMP